MFLNKKFNRPICSEIKTIIDSFGSHLNVELQQRGVEFSQLFRGHNHLRTALMEKMPPMQVNRVGQQNGGDSTDENSGSIELLDNVTGGGEGDTNGGDSVSNLNF